jgi:hypothetical protein
MFRRLQGHHQGGLHKGTKVRHKSRENSVKNVRVRNWNTTVSKLLKILKIQVNFLTVKKNKTSSSIADKRLCPLLSPPFKREYPCVVCLVFRPCGPLSTVSKIRYSYSALSETPVNVLLHELNNNVVKSQSCSQEWSHRQSIMVSCLRK